MGFSSYFIYCSSIMNGLQYSFPSKVDESIDRLIDVKGITRQFQMSHPGDIQSV